MSTRPLRFGAFFAPFHPVGQSPTLALEYDLQRVEELDRLGYDEAWFGEHHSGGFELINCPEIFIAAAAGRTKNIKLGTGVVSLPYHHPWLVADRICLLDHLTRGRIIFGTGPGALPTDAYVMGIDPVEQRRMMEESLEAILALFTSEEPITRETDWFTIRDGRLQMRPYSYPHPEVAVAAMVTPSGPRLAGRHNVSLLSLSMSLAEGFAAIGQAWDVVTEMAAKAGQPEPDRSTWRILGNLHIAETREQAIEDCTYGLKDFTGYFGGGAGFVPLANKVDDAEETPQDFVRRYIDAGGVVIGTPDDAIEYIQGLIDQSGGFGTFLMLGHDWASPAATMQSYRLFAEKVIPHFQGQLSAPRASHDWATAHRRELFGRAGQAMLNAIQTHVEEKAADAQAAAGATRPATGNGKATKTPKAAKATKAATGNGTAAKAPATTAATNGKTTTAPATTRPTNATGATKATTASARGKASANGTTTNGRAPTTTAATNTKAAQGKASARGKASANGTTTNGRAPTTTAATNTKAAQGKASARGKASANGKAAKATKGVTA